MRIHFLGTASGLPTARRFSQTTVIEHRGGLHVLDVADGASSLLRRHRLDHDAIRSIAISHMHGDHHSGLVQVLKTALHLGRTRPLTIYMPEEAIELYQAFMEMCYLAPEMMTYSIDWRPIRVDRPLDLGDELSLTAFHNDHLAHAKERAGEMASPPKGWRYESYSFVLKNGRHSLAYTGNLKSSLKEVIPFSKGTDVLISELAHLDVRECIEAVAEIRPRIAIFSHISPKWDDGCPPLASQPVPGVHVVMTEDGDVFDVDEMLDASREVQFA